MHKKNSFLTLTYDDEHVPGDGSLVPHHFTDFMKRLRKRNEGTKIRYYMCGEYGADVFQPQGLGRPHFHACLFGFDPGDKKHWSTSHGEPLFTSDSIAETWGKGFATVGKLSFESAAYVARYVAKKVNGDRAYSHYWKVNYRTGEIGEVEPEFGRMSRRPGVGRTWWEKFKKDTHKGFITVRGKKCKVPRYYDELLMLEQPDLMLAIKEDREIEAKARAWDNTELRLLQKEECAYNRFNKLTRVLT